MLSTASPLAARYGLAANYSAVAHPSLLRTIEASWGLAPLTASDAAAPAMSDFFPLG